MLIITSQLFLLTSLTRLDRSPGLTQGSGKKLPTEANGTKGHITITVAKERTGIAEDNDDVRANTLANRAIVAARTALRVIKLMFTHIQCVSLMSN